MFLGSLYCPHCGAKAVQPKFENDERSSLCPRCHLQMDVLEIETITLRECEKCGGLWSNVETFEEICADRERQSAVLGFIADKRNAASNNTNVALRYVPCPDCGQLMNRSNFARLSGVIIDACKQHGVWFDTNELPRTIEFIRAGGLDRARAREKLQIQEERYRLSEAQRKNHEADDNYERESMRFLFK